MVEAEQESAVGRAVPSLQQGSSRARGSRGHGGSDCGETRPPCHLRKLVMFDNRTDEREIEQRHSERYRKEKLWPRVFFCFCVEHLTLFAHEESGRRLNPGAQIKLHTP